MIYVLLDSSTNYLSVGIANDNHIIGKTSYESWQTQSENMIPELKKLFDDNKVDFLDIGAVIVAVGPGSYTGVRIALTCAKVISLALSCPIYPVSSLRILKDDILPSICLINARSGRSYFGVYEGSKILVEDKILKNEEVKEYISSHPEYVIKGDASYLGIEKSESDIIKQMFLLKDFLLETNDTLGMKPIYMKD